MDTVEVMAEVLYGHHEFQGRGKEYIENDLQTGKQIYSADEIQRCMIAFAQNKVKEALLKAALKTKNKSILNIYPLDNIK